MLNTTQQPHSYFWGSCCPESLTPFLLSCMPTHSLCEIVGRAYPWLSALEVRAHLERVDRTTLERLAALVLDREQCAITIHQPVVEPATQREGVTC
jgi:hypothetical protein